MLDVMLRFCGRDGTWRSRGALLLAIALLPGWILPPACAACPHGTPDEALDAGPPAATEPHAHDDGDRSADPVHDGGKLSDEPAHDDHDCGCPCDLECAAPDLATPRPSDATASSDGDASVRTIVAAALRPAAPRFPSFFLPLSNAPPR